VHRGASPTADGRTRIVGWRAGLVNFGGITVCTTSRFWSDAAAALRAAYRVAAPETHWNEALTLEVDVTAGLLAAWADRQLFRDTAYPPYSLAPGIAYSATDAASETRLASVIVFDAEGIAFEKVIAEEYTDAEAGTHIAVAELLAVVRFVECVVAGASRDVGTPICTCDNLSAISWFANRRARNAAALVLLADGASSRCTCAATTTPRTIRHASEPTRCRRTTGYARRERRWRRAVGFLTGRGVRMSAHAALA
jgi:hypothetical protein